MAKLKNGKLLEWQVVGHPAMLPVGEHGAGRAEVLARWGGSGYTITQETGERARFEFVSPVTGAAHRLGRGERVFDGVLETPIVVGAIVARTPISVKGGDSRDLTADVALMRAMVETGQPLWVWCVTGTHPDGGREVREGLTLLSGDALNLTVRRINVTPLLQGIDWTPGPALGRTAFVRVAKQGPYTYSRVRINFKKLPESAWADQGPVTLDEAIRLQGIDALAEIA
jgi:hypothetical protein